MPTKDQFARRRARLSERRVGLSEEKRALLEKRMRGEAAESVPDAGIPRRSGEGPTPLSFAQQRLWFLDQLEPGSATYNIPLAVQLSGRLDVPALAHSLSEIVRRHNALRTTFASRDGQAVQVIAPPLKLVLPLVSLAALPKAEREAQVRRLAVEEAQRPFDLSHGPLLRVILLRLDERENVLLLTMHHIISDGWSIGVLVHELTALYPAFVTGKQSPLPDLPIQYADFAAWQRAWLQGEVLETQLTYWKEQLGHDGSTELAEVLPVLELPTDHPRPPLQTFRGTHHTFKLSRALTEALKALSQHEGTTLFMTLLAAFKTLLYRYTGQEDVAVGSPIANRNHSQIEGLIGFFVNTLVLRSDLSGDPTFRQLLGRVREVTLGAYAHQDLPFETLVDALQPARNLSHSPLFQVLFVLQNAPQEALELPELTLRLMDADSGASKFDLTLSLIETAQGLVGEIEYNRDLFEASTIARLAVHYERLLEGVVNDPDQRLWELPLLTADERQRLLGAWNETQLVYPTHLCLHQLFEAQAGRTPDAIALVFKDQHLTYADLDLRAEQLAHHLRELGVGPESLVAICAERLPDVVVGVLGTLQAGAAYVPLDPRYPSERTAFILADTQAPVLLTQRRLVERLPEHNTSVVYLDAGEPIITSSCGDVPIPGITAQHLAYVIYTSGSTGQPKGVAIQHRSAVALVQWALDAFDRTSFEGVLAATSLCFDLSIFELFVPLSYGGTVILAQDLLHLPELPAAARVTLVNSVPSALAELLRLGDLPHAVRVVNLAGEPLQTGLVAQLYEQPQVARVFDLYGPSEDTTYSTYALRSAAGPETIGHPVANTQVHLLDSHLNPVPVGVPGELHLGGDGLARSYLHRPAQTAERFVPNPFASRRGRRLYKTGDLARYLPDGQLQFLGRLDRQVKLRGFRIDLGEIETVLRQYPQVQESVALVCEDQPGDKRLVAYLVAAEDPAPTVSELRRFLHERLPEYMIPSAFVTLDALPLTPNNKINRRALPPPDRVSRDLEKTFVAPRTPAEEMLAGIWYQVLGLQGIGVHDDFFALGGHSLLATQVISRVRDTFQIELPLRELFAAPTVASLARRIERARGVDQGLLAPPILPVSRDTDAELLLSFAQQRLWFLDQLEPGSAAYNIPLAVQLSGQLDLSALTHSLNEIVRRHETLRTAFVTVDGQPVQIITPALTLTMPVVDLATLPAAGREAQVRRLAVEEAQRPFDLPHGPLMRVILLRLDEACPARAARRVSKQGRRAEHVLLLTMHHIISDGWSIGVLVHELAALYPAFVTGKQSPLPELPIQYADFAAWQRAWLQGEVLETQLTYWKEQLSHDGSTELAEVPPVLELPTDRPRPPLQTFRGATRSFVLAEDLSAALRALSREGDSTLFMTLLAGFKVLLYRYTGQEDIVVGSPIANRNRAEIEGLIGFFVNTLVLRTDLSGDPTFRELLGRVREVTLGAYAHQDVPFEMLVEALQPERDLSRSPLFQVMFTLQNAPREPLLLPGLTLSPLEAESGTAKFDLTLALVETRQGLEGTLEYNSDLFEGDTMERLVGHWQTLLLGIVADPGRRLSELPLLAEAERRQVLDEWNATHAAYPQKTCLHELVQTQVERTPDAVALLCQDQHLTYGDLNRRANQLAHHLQGLGVGPEVAVGICVERSPEMIVGLLGILKAGGAYLPLSPAYPEERLAFMLNDARVPALLIQERLVGRLPAHQARVVRLDADWETVARESDGNPESGATPDNLAYVIYTSGSTGRPKGVMIEHESLVNYLWWANEGLLGDAVQRLPATTSFTFDASLKQLFVPLLRGGEVWLVPDRVLSEPVALLQEIAARCGARFNCVPSLWQAMLDTIQSGQNTTPGKDLTTLLVGGEAIGKELLERTFSILPHLQVWNLYGPTEGTANASAARLAPGGDVTIGRPIANAQLYALDRRGQPVPVGIPGELHIGGVGVARGYLGRPELTAERFVPSPFSPPGEGKGVGGRRLYKTGDLGRYRPDGNIEFLGRLDHQVKLRGFRIELGEIEAVLRQHPQVQESVTLVREDQPGGKRLVAYVVGTEPTPTATELRHFLRERLPEYMIPSAFVTLDALLLTPSGKVDRRALPSPEGAGLDLGQTPVAPRDALELRLARIWEQVLGERPVGVTHNFFELGGHSLLAVRLVARIRQDLGQELPLAVLFSDPTVERLAVLLRQHSERRLPFSALVPLQVGQPDRLPLFLVHPGGGNVFCYADLVRHLDPEQPCYGLQARGLDKEQAPHTRVEAMAGYYLEWVRTVQAEGPYQLGGWSVGGVIAFEMAQQLQVRGQEVALLALIDSHAPTGVEPEPDDLKLLGGFALDLGLPLQWLRLDLDDLRALSADERLAVVLQEAKRAQVIPGDVDLAQVCHLFRVFKNNVQAVRRYVARAYARPVVLFKAQEQRGDFAPDLGWRAVAGGGLAVQTVPGDHYAIVREPHVAALAAHIQCRLCVQKESK